MTFWDIIDDALKTGLVMNCFSLKTMKRQLVFMEAGPDTLLKIIIYYCPDKVDGLPADIARRTVFYLVHFYIAKWQTS
jgi:hypothetical protein